MFRKSLVAAALTAASFAGHAATVTVAAPGTISLEGTVGDANGVPMATTTVTLGAEYTVGDTITFTISGAEFDTTNSVPAIAVELLGADGATGGTGDNADDDATLGLLSVTSSAVTFRITSQTDNGTDGVTYAVGGNNTFELSGMVLTTASVTDTAGDVDVTYSALTQTNLPLDTAGTLTETSDEVVAQLSSSVTKALNGVIDVNNDRQQFTTADEGVNDDELVVTPVEAAAATNDVTYSGATYVISGDFSWMETDGTDGIDAAELGAAFAVTGAGDDTFTTAINDDANQITVTATDAGADAVEVTTFTFTNAGAGTDSAVLPEQSYTVDVTLAYDAPAAAAASKATQSGASAGAWTLNGSVIEVPYLPFGPNTQPIFRHTNTGSDTGDITMRYMVEGVDTTWQDAGVILADAAPGVRNILSEITAAFAAAGYDASASGFKAAVEITTNVPDGDVTLTVGAKFSNQVDTDRLTIGTFN